MKSKLLFPVLILFLFGACATSSKFVARGEYDAAIEKAVQRLRQNKDREKDVFALHQAYNTVMNADISRIAALQNSDAPERWDEIYQLYQRIGYRQQLIRPLLPLTVGENKGQAQFEMTPYDKETGQAKYNAADYHYMKAIKLLDRKTRPDARKAWEELQKVKNYYSEFRSLDEQLDRAVNQGTSRVLLRIENRAGAMMPDAFFQEIVRLNVNELSGPWVSVDTRRNANQKYDYTVMLNIHTLDVSPESFRQNNFTEKKEVPNGFRYVLDAKGNVLKDTSGNDIKIPQYTTISCNVMEIWQQKRAIIRGSLEFIDNSSGQLIGTDPVWAESIFEHRFATAHGNPDALCAETRNHLGGFVVAFPTDPDMLLRAAEILKNEIKRRVRNSHNLLG